MASEGTRVASRATSREWIGLSVIALACLLYVMDLSVLYLAVPSLARDLQPSSSQLLWITDIYGFLVAGLLITMGSLGDRFGRRKILLLGAAGFGAASLFAAFATSAGMLILARAMLGIAGATVAPSTLALIRNMFHDPQQRTKAISIWGTSFALGGAAGPLIGGALLEHFWWGSVFLINVPVMVVLLVLGPRLLPEYRDPNPGPLDFGSVVLSLASVLGVIYGLKQIAQDGVGPTAMASIAAGLVIGLFFARRQLRLRHPLIDLRLFRTPAFGVSVGTNALGGFIAFGTFLYFAQYLQLVVGLSPWSAALWTLPSSVAVVISSLMAPAVVGRIRPALAAAGGLSLVAIGLGILALVDASSSLQLPVLGSIVFSLGLGPVFIVTTDLIVGTAPPEKAGAASAISETGAEFGGAIGIAILGSIGTAIYRGRVFDSIPEGLPAAARETARDTLGGALGVARQLPGRLGDGLIDAARDAFAAGLRVSVSISALIAVFVAVLVGTKLRGIRSTVHDDAETPAAPHPERALEPASAEA